MTELYIKPKTTEISLKGANTVSSSRLVRCFNSAAGREQIRVGTALEGNVNVSSSANTVTGTGTDFGSLVANDYVIITANSTGGSAVGQIDAVTNSTHLVLKANFAFSNTAAKINKLTGNTTINTKAALFIQKEPTSVLQGNNILAIGMAFGD